MHRFRPISALAVALVLAACADAGGSPSAAAPDETSAAASSAPASASAAPASEAPNGESVEVTLEGFAFDTEALTVAAGTEVVFVNNDGAAHTVTEGTDGTAADDPMLDEELGAGESASFTFDEPGTYEITCLFHPTMNMTVTVEG
jgi:plastocyanin